MKPLPKFTAVIHVSNDAQAVEQTDIALTEGAGGVFLIDHGASHNALLTSYLRVRDRFPKAWIGLNFLDLRPVRGIERMPHDADALWMDSISGMDLRDLVGNMPWRIFGGAAFKYQPTMETDTDEAIFVANRLRAQDVITTSGVATGEPPAVRKVQDMDEILRQRLLAVASGITPENAGLYAQMVDCFLVATGISKSFHELDPARVRALAEIVA